MDQAEAAWRDVNASMLKMTGQPCDPSLKISFLNEYIKSLENGEKPKDGPDATD